MLKTYLSGRWKAVVAALCTVVLGVTPAFAYANATSGSVAIQFKNHLELGYPVQDVFIQSPTDASKVVRIAAGTLVTDAVRTQPLYAAATVVAHDYTRTGMSPLGPFDKGVPLQLTAGNWLDGRGSGSYESDGAFARLDLSFSGLVPSAQYSVWCNQVTYAPDASVTQRPCGSSDGVNNGFMTNGSGEARFELSLSPLPKSTAYQATVLTVVYHSDWATHGSRPGDFGLNAHEQLMFFFPNESGIITPPPSGGNICMQNAVVARDNALIGAAQTYSAALSDALRSRGLTLAAAWGMLDTSARNKKIAATWTTFIHSRNDARKQLTASRNSIWAGYRTARKTCTQPTADAGRESFDAAW